MENVEHKPFTDGLPPELLKQFEALRRRLHLRRSILATSTGVGGLLISFLSLFALDRLGETPGPTRWLLFVLGLLFAVFSIAYWLVGRIRLKDEQRKLAVLVQKKHPRLGDRLLGIVELASGDRIPDGMSPALCRAAIRQVAAEADKTEFVTAVDWRRARIVGTIASVSGVVVIFTFSIAFDASRNTLSRLLSPGAGIPRYTFVTVEDIPKRMIVPHGEPFELRVRIHSKTRFRSATVSAQIGEQPPTKSRITNGIAWIRFSGQTEVGKMLIRAADGAAELIIEPLIRPSLKSMESEIKLPPYLELATVNQPVAAGALVYVKGSEAKFRAEINRTITNALVQASGRGETPLQPTGNRFATEWIKLDGLSEVQFAWHDEFGLAVLVPWKLTLQETTDEAPRTTLVDMPQTTALLVTEVMNVAAAAQDDFGVKELSLVWEASGADGATVSSGDSDSFRIVSTNSADRQLEHVFRFSPMLLGIKEDSIVELRSRAIDRFPGRVPSESALYRIMVVSAERHAELVRQQLETILTKVEDITRQQEGLLHATQALLERKDMESAEAASKASELSEQQDLTSRNLENLSKEGADVLREAMRNEKFSEKNLREWSRNLGEMKQVAQKQMQQAKAALQKASKETSERAEQTQEAAAKEEESLQALEQMQKRMNTGLDNLQAMTLAQRLKRLAGVETDYESLLIKMAPETIGLTPTELTPRQRAKQSEIADDQLETQTQTLALQAEISRFFDRTQNPPYGEVSKEMVDSHVGSELERISGLIRSNIVMDASLDLGGWSKRLADWAARLEPKSESEDGSAGGSQGENAPQDDAMMKQIMGLIRLRDRQMTTLNMTRLLDQAKPTDSAYADKAKTLALTQGKIADDFRQARIENRLPNLVQAYEDALPPFLSSTELLSKPQTDVATQNSERSAIEQLTDLINLINELTQNGPKSQSSSSQSAEAQMEMLMQMAQQEGSSGMSMEPGEAPGGNNNGGSTQRRGEAFQGSTQGKAPNARSLPRLGSDTRNFPTEFRDALENFFKAIEKEGLQ